MGDNSFIELLRRAEQGETYWVERAILDFTENLVSLMEEKGVSKAELARRIEKSPAYITKVMRGNTNFTIESMVRLVRAVDGQLCIRATHQDRDVRWFDVVRTSQRHQAPPDQGDFHPVTETDSTRRQQGVFNDTVASAA